MTRALSSRSQGDRHLQPDFLRMYKVWSGLILSSRLMRLSAGHLRLVENDKSVGEGRAGLDCRCKPW